MVGLHSGTHSKLIVIGGILIIAIADAFSDALGIHISKESETKHSTKEIWQSTLVTFIFKFFTALGFILPILLLPFSTAIIVSVVYGLLLLGIFNSYIAAGQENKKWKVVREHLLIAPLVILITHFVGNWIRSRLSWVKQLEILFLSF